ncbi:MAG: exopolysaccharide biosynthesis protein [Pseudomonadota bacterium]
MTNVEAEPIAISQRLARLATEPEGERVTLGWILDQLHERAFGLFLLILALPCCIPFLYGVPQIVALPLVFVSAQIVAGRRVPWLPERLRARSVGVSSLSELSRRAGPWLERIEAISRPRLGALSRPPADRVVGLALLLFSASILVPLPGTNTVPGFAVVLVAMGLLQRDGLLVIGGSTLGTVWIATLLFAGATITSLVTGWLGMSDAADGTPVSGVFEAARYLL